MVDGIEECFEIAVDHIASLPSWFAEFMHLLDGILSAFVGSIPKAVLVELRFIEGR